MKKQKTSLFFKFSKQASHEFEFPLYLSIIFQALSYAQIISSIIKSTFPDAVNSINAVNFLKQIFVATSIFGDWNIFYSTTTSEAIWCIIIAYIIIQLLMLCGVVLMLFLGTRKQIFYKIFSLNLLIHSRLLFYPIHYLCLQIIGFFTYDTTAVNSFFRSNAILIVSIGIVVVNILLSFVKEMWLYRVTKSKNTYSCHSNLSNQLVLFHKVIIPFILLVAKPTNTTSTAIAIISILHTIIILFTLYTRLPFYNYNLMRFTYFLSALTFPFGVIGLFNTFLKGNDILETMLVVGTAILAKGAMVVLNDLFEKILSGDISTPEKSIYYPILLKQFTSKNSGLSLTRKSFSVESLYYYSTFDPKLDEQKNLKDRKLSRLRKQEFYAAILGKLMSSRTNYQRSAILMLYMARIYMKKLDNASKALDLIRKVTGLNASIPIRNSLESFQTSLQDAYLQAFSYSTEDLELSKYFIYREEFTSLKENMQLEIKLHLDFWQQISQDDTNVKKVVDLANQIDSVYLKIKDRWQKSSERFASVYPSSLLMYGLYLDTIRGLPQESMQAIQKFYNYNKNGDYKKKMNSLSETSAIIITSMEKEKIGQVVDASSTVESLFEISKEKLVGDKVNTLMPGFIAKDHDYWLEQYARNSVGKGANTQIVSYAKKLNGTLVHIDINVKLYPYLDQGVNLMGHIIQRSVEENSFIVKPDGGITECSPKLLEILNKLGVNLKQINLFDACRKFASINESFNIVYGPKEQNKEDASPNKQGLPTDDQYTMQNTYNYTNMETLGDQLYAQKNRTEVMPLVNNHTEIDRFETMKQTLTITSSFKSKFHTSEFKSVTGRKIQVVLSEDEAHEICEEYRSCGYLKLKVKNPNGGAKQLKVQLDVIVEPYVVGDCVYKVIKVIDGQIDERDSIDNSFETRKKLFTLMEKSDQFDANLSPLASSVPSQWSAPEAGEIPDERSFQVDFTKEEVKQTKSFIKKQFSVKESESKLPTQKKFDSLGQMQTKEDLQNLDIRQSITGKSSTKSYSHMDFKLIKTLHDFFGERKVRLITRLSIYAVYLIMVAVLVLAFINFFFTQRSLTEIDNGVEIVNLVGKRLTSSLRAWQYALLIYARVVGIRPRSGIASLIAGKLATESRTMQDLNGELRSKINIIGSNEIIQEMFSSKTRFYDPVTKLTLTNGTLDIFSANNVLSLADRAMANTSLSDTQLASMNEPLMTINNTANDFLVSSETQISQIIGGLQTIITKNVSLLTTILIFENLSLLFLCMALIFVVRVVLQSYSRTFTAIVRITNESIAERIYKITKFQTSLNENIEAKSFLTNLNLYMEFFEESKIDKKMMKGKDKKQRFFNKRYTMKDLNLYLLQYLAVSFFFILVISGLFIVLFVQSNKSFNTLNSISDQLSVTSGLSYQSSLLVGNVYEVLIFQNRTDILVRNGDPEDQLAQNLDTFSGVNDQLLTTLFSGSSDPVIESFLQNDICSYLDTSIQSTCLDSTQGGALGLLSFNLKFYTVTNNYVNMLYADKTLTTTMFIAQYYFGNVTLDLTVLEAAYTFLTQYILDGFNSEVQSLETVNILLSMGSVLVILIATFMIQQISLRTFINLDNSQKKIFRTLTYYVFSQNKSVGFLLKKEFGNDIEGLNRILYV